MDLSNNNLSGKILVGPQLNTFNATAYEGNPNLCGFPLPKKCFGEEITLNSTVNGGHASMQDEEDGFITLGFYVCAALGFVISFWHITTKQATTNLQFQVPELCLGKGVRDRSSGYGYITKAASNIIGSNCFSTILVIVTTMHPCHSNNYYYCCCCCLFSSFSLIIFFLDD